MEYLHNNNSSAEMAYDNSEFLLMPSQAVLHYELFDPTMALQEDSKLIGISVGGLKFVSLKKLEQNDLLDISFRAQQEQNTIKTKARVIRCSHVRKCHNKLYNYRVNVKFLNMRHSDLKIIKGLIEHAKKEDEGNVVFVTNKWWQFWKRFSFSSF